MWNSSKYITKIIIDTGTFCNKVIMVDMYLVKTGIQKVRINLVYTGIKERRHRFVLHWNKKKWTSGLFNPE